MKRIYFISEGQTEVEFVEQLLRPYFFSKGFFDVRAIMIETSAGHKGGVVNYDHLKKLILRLIKEEPTVVVTTFIDFFKLPKNFPEYHNCMKMGDSGTKINCLERNLVKDISKTVSTKHFVPYIQQHEFEALLFSTNAGFEYCYESDIYEKTAKIVELFPNPEDINDSPLTAPSKRILEAFPDYNKIVDGNMIALEIGIETILCRCPRFSNWVEKLIAQANEQK